MEISNIFNNFFIDKVRKLKEGIDNTFIEDPLSKLEEKMASNGEDKNTVKFSLKLINKKELTATMKRLKKKTSAGIDGLSQDKLVYGSSVLSDPLLCIINQSIKEGVFPAEWTHALVTPVLKKGSSSLMENYRPVSCLPAASKILEMVVCDQTSVYMETNNLLPHNQHGFRPRRSTMTAWADIQNEWSNNTDAKDITGVLLWDLSAAFDCVDPDLLCRKLKLYGFDEMAVKWFHSFLSQRYQSVKIGEKVSDKMELESGVPQGGIISPLAFVIFVSDLDLWLNHSSASTYADDTETNTVGKDIKLVCEKMEADANEVLKFMASNGLIANPKKTALVFLNLKKEEAHIPIKLKIGNDYVMQEKSAKLLGITFDENQKWQTHINEKGGLISTLNQRLFMIRRLKNVVKSEALMKISDSLFTSKIRYGIQLFGCVRLNDSDPTNGLIDDIQLIQNKLVRLLNGKRIKDRISTKILLSKVGMLSVNQLNAQIKLLDIWKAINVKDYPYKPMYIEREEAIVQTRACSAKILKEVARSNLSKGTFRNDALRIWNLAPSTIRDCKTLYAVKKVIKIYVTSLPI